MKEYRLILIPIVVVIITQIIKFTIESFKTKKLVWKRLFNGSGGMPSSHTALVSSLTAIIGLTEGFNTSTFAISLVFFLVVAYDSMNVRNESGKQAKMINIISNKMKEERKLDNVSILREMLGHKPLEVIIGALFGIIVTILLNIII